MSFNKSTTLGVWSVLRWYYMTLSEPFLWVIWLSSVLTRDSCNTKKPLSIPRLLCFGAPRFCGCTRVMRRNSSCRCLDRGQSSRSHAHRGGSHSSNHFLRRRVSPFFFRVHEALTSRLMPSLSNHYTHTLFFHYGFFFFNHYDACFVTSKPSHSLVYFQMM